MPWGTPDQVLEKVAFIRDTIGIAGFLPDFSYGGMPYDEAERSLRLFAAEVLPELQRWDSPPVGEAVPPRCRRLGGLQRNGDGAPARAGRCVRRCRERRHGHPALVAGLAIPRIGETAPKSPPNLAGPTGIALYVVAAVGFAAGLALYLLARRKAVKYEPAEGFDPGRDRPGRCVPGAVLRPGLLQQRLMRGGGP